MKLDDHPLAAPASRATLRRAGIIGLAALALLLSGATVRVYSKNQEASSLATRTAADAVREVQTTQARPGEPKRNLTLPGTLQGQRETAVYARASGCRQRWTRDIGDQVKQGELLAIIDAPEAEQELL